MIDKVGLDQQTEDSKYMIKPLSGFSIPSDKIVNARVFDSIEIICPDILI